MDILPGTLEIIGLRALKAMGPEHAYGANSIRLNQGTLYPALVRLEQKGWICGAWKTTENNREAKYYAITRSGTRALAEQSERRQRSADLVNRLLTDEASR